LLAALLPSLNTTMHAFPLLTFFSFTSYPLQAFESQDLPRLQGVLASMDPDEAKACMKRCVDSGLWVPKDASIFEDMGGVETDDDDDDDDAEEEGEVQVEGSGVAKSSTENVLSSADDIE